MSKRQQTNDSNDTMFVKGKKEVNIRGEIIV